jgi:hypothetical protein
MKTIEISDDHKLRELENLITREYAQARRPDHPRHHTYLALKDAARELRSRMEYRVSETEVMLAKAITVFSENRNPETADHLACEVRARWSTVRQALRHFSRVMA